MSGSNKRSVREKITLFILMLLASPFIISFLVIFLLVYIIVYPFEILIYNRSLYYKDLNDKYYLFITLNKKIKLYNKIRKKGVEDTLNDQKIYRYDNYILNYCNDENCVLSADKIIMKEHSSYINLVCIKKNKLSEEQYKKIRTQSNIIIYD